MTIGNSFDRDILQSVGDTVICGHSFKSNNSDIIYAPCLGRDGASGRDMDGRALKCICEI
jgi:hypothetical protein